MKPCTNQAFDRVNLRTCKYNPPSLRASVAAVGKGNVKAMHIERGIAC